VNCRGAGCETCNHVGTVKITQCPQTLITEDVRTFLKFYGLSENGIMPVDGGALDQTQSFIDAMHYLQCRENEIETERWQKND
jgi:hypothetical protein